MLPSWLDQILPPDTGKEARFQRESEKQLTCEYNKYFTKSYRAEKEFVANNRISRRSESEIPLGVKRDKSRGPP